MKPYRKHLEKLRLLKRREYHPLVHKIHKKHKISRKTLFYVKEYGAHTNVPRTIIKESIKILILASIISSLGGLSLEIHKTVFVSLVPFVILLPVLNNLIGTYGTIFSSRVSTMLHEGKISGNWWKNMHLHKLLLQVLVVSVIMAVLSASIAIAISAIAGFSLSSTVVSAIFIVAIVDVLALVCILFVVSAVAGLHFYRKKEDPNNFLIPITTSIADFGNMIILSVLIILVF